MTWLLDTNVIRAAMRGVGGVADRLRATPPSAIVLSPISVTELRYGASRRGSATLDASLAQLLGDLLVAPLNQDAADLAGRLMADHERMGRPLSLADALIAAQSLHLRCTLVTHDRDFADIPGLVIEDWQGM